MSPVLKEALSLLLSGMVTVFLVLGLVVLMGRLLIILVNKLNVSNKELSNTKQSLPTPHQVSPQVLAVLTAAVDVATKGKGIAKKIELSSKIKPNE